MKFKEFIDGPEVPKKEEDGKLTVKDWLNELTDGKGLDTEKVYIIVGSFINKLKQ
jgi:hypothetical protein